MLIKTFYIIILFFIFISNSYSAASSSDSTKSNYDKAANLIKTAKRYQKALELLVKANKEKPNQADTLNYLGFATRKLGDYESGERYYLLGLEIDPTHKGINEYLGELYVVTNRIDLAKERLSVLESCNCEEYDELKEIIEGNKKSKY